MFRFANISNYNSASKTGTDLDILKMFTLEDEVKKEELFNIGGLCNLACDLQSDFFFFTKPHIVCFHKDTPFNLTSVPNIVRNVSSALKVDYYTDIQPYMYINLASDGRVIQLSFQLNNIRDLYTQEMETSINSIGSLPCICRSTARFKGVFEINHSARTFFINELNTKQLEGYLWDRGFVARVRPSFESVRHITREAIEEAEELCELYLQKYPSAFNVGERTPDVWMSSIIDTLRYIDRNCRWPGYSTFHNNVKALLKKY